MLAKGEKREWKKVTDKGYIKFTIERPEKISYTALVGWLLVFSGLIYYFLIR
jgi:hypothetical protein